MKPPRLKSQHGILTCRGSMQIMAWVVLAASLQPLPAYASFVSSAGETGQHISSGVTDLVIHEQKMNIAGRDAIATTINGSMPGPLLRFREGETATIRVTNKLKETTSIHWHGLLVPYEMDGVPGVSFPGIKPGETFTYRFKLRQSGTYWYHSHSGMQEQTGVYGPLLIEPTEREVLPYDREYVVMLSDWTFEDPTRVLAKLKKSSSYYNFNQRTIADFFRDAWRHGWGSTISDRLMWGRMRMNPTDILDITAYTYTYLINGLSSELNWTALFKAGERVRPVHQCRGHDHF